MSASAWQHVGTGGEVAAAASAAGAGGEIAAAKAAAVGVALWTTTGWAPRGAAITTVACRARCAAWSRVLRCARRGGAASSQEKKRSHVTTPRNAAPHRAYAMQLPLLGGPPGHAATSAAPLLVPPPCCPVLLARPAAGDAFEQCSAAGGGLRPSGLSDARHPVRKRRPLRMRAVLRPGLLRPARPPGAGCCPPCSVHARPAALGAWPGSMWPQRRASRSLPHVPTHLPALPGMQRPGAHLACHRPAAGSAAAAAAAPGALPARGHGVRHRGGAAPKR